MAFTPRVTTTTTFSGRSDITTSWIGRSSIAITNTISPIVTGLWNDAATWDEAGKYWNDLGDVAGTSWVNRIIPT